jgi:hypothetical protein
LATPRGPDLLSAGSKGRQRKMVKDSQAQKKDTRRTKKGTVRWKGERTREGERERWSIL